MTSLSSSIASTPMMTEAPRIIIDLAALRATAAATALDPIRPVHVTDQDGAPAGDGALGKRKVRTGVAATTCEHGRVKRACAECNGAGVLDDGRPATVKWVGANLCEHGRRRYRCKDCGADICKHYRQRLNCKEGCAALPRRVSLPNPPQTAPQQALSDDAVAADAATAAEAAADADP